MNPSYRSRFFVTSYPAQRVGLNSSPAFQASRHSEQGGEESGTEGHVLDLDVLKGGMSAVTNGSEAVKGRDAERSGEVSVGAAACGALAESVAHLSRE